jgi:ABC-type Mn2+/Zn2+ transport system permease subunit
MLITPGAIAHLLTDRFDRMLGIAAGVSVVACIVGAYSSYYFDVSTGGAMVLVLGGLFVLTFLFAPTYGLLSRLRSSKNQQRGYNKKGTI